MTTFQITSCETWLEHANQRIWQCLSHEIKKEFFLVVVDIAGVKMK